jgi:hypothetical protein
MTVTVYHGSSFGHNVEVDTVTRGRDLDTIDVVGAWKGIGIPEKVYEGILASVEAILEDHLMHRYGIAAEVPGLWEVEPDPF